MRPLSDFFRSRPGPWVLAGKGPSFARRAELLPPGRPVLGLNHVCRLHLCELTHFTDLDAFLACGAALTFQAGGVVLPWRPHVRFRPGKRTLAELVDTTPELAALADAGRLFAYNSTLCRDRRVGLSTHHTRFFSAVVGLDILAVHGGADTIYTIGVDGGTHYAPGFDPATRLSNGRPSFDAQFAEMRKVAARYRVAVRPLAEEAK